MRLDCSYRFTSSDDMGTSEDVETFFPVIIYDDVDDVMSSTGVNRMEENVERGKARKGRCRCLHSDLISVVCCEKAHFTLLKIELNLFQYINRNA